MLVFPDIETLLTHLDKKKYPLPESGFHFEKARELFNEPEVTSKADVDVSPHENIHSVA